jgi:hypothetical protein
MKIKYRKIKIKNNGFAKILLVIDIAYATIILTKQHANLIF